MKNRKVLMTSAVLAALAFAVMNSSAGATGAKAKSRICLVLPKAQLGQGETGTDVAEPVRQTLTSYLSGPAAEIVPLTARIPIQIDSEAEQSNCEYVLYTSLVQKKSGGGFGKFFQMAAPAAGALPGVAGATGSYGTQVAAHAATSVITNAAAKQQQEEARAKLSGASQTHIHKGDQVTLEYKLQKAGVTEAVQPKSIVVKAKDDGEDLLSPLLEQTATAVLTVITQAATR
jgi:hypothetical protein